MAIFALRYARAFTQVAEAAGLDIVVAREQLEDFASTFAGSRELREFLMNPSIAQDDKLKVLDAIGARIGIFPQVRNFLAVIMGHDRLGDIAEIFSTFAADADKDSGIADVEIVSAHPLNPEERGLLEGEVSKLAGGKIRAAYTEDAGLLGGAVVRIGSTVYDGSVRAQLEHLRQQLVSA